MTSSPHHYQYYLVMGPDFYGSVLMRKFLCAPYFLASFILCRIPKIPDKIYFILF